MDINQGADSIDEQKVKEGIDNLKNLSEADIEEIIRFKQIHDDPTLQEDIKKLIDCPHEIIFTITAHTLAQNEKGELTGTTEICTKNYHIPVPIDKDYRHYMHIFFEHLENKMLEAISESNKKSKDNEENQDDK